MKTIRILTKDELTRLDEAIERAEKLVAHCDGAEIGDPEPLAKELLDALYAIRSEDSDAERITDL